VTERQPFRGPDRGITGEARQVGVWRGAARIDAGKGLRRSRAPAREASQGAGPAVGHRGDASNSDVGSGGVGSRQEQRHVGG